VKAISNDTTHTVDLKELQKKILALVASGKRDRAIARELDLPAVGRVTYRVGTMPKAFGLRAATRQQLVNLAYQCGVLPPPPLQKPVLLPRDQEQLLHALITWESADRYYRSQGLSRKQGDYLQHKLLRSLGAQTPAHAVAQAWAHQILGPSQFASDLRSIRALAISQHLMDGAVIVPLSQHRYRLAVPIGPGRLTGFLAHDQGADALAVHAALREQPGFPDVRIVHVTSTPRTPYTVVWGKGPATPSAPPVQLPDICSPGALAPSPA
jgi:hypothetical protein